jgi:hypothetical protein
VDNVPGYEPDAAFNTDNGNYLGNVTNWSDNTGRWTYPYLDTSFGDLQYYVWTIGISQAAFLHFDKFYFTHITTRPGSSSVDYGELYGQVTYPLPRLCHWAWCMFGDHSHVYIGPWHYEVPHNTFLTYEQ